MTTSLKRKASQELTPNSIVVLEPAQRNPQSRTTMFQALAGIWMWMATACSFGYFDLRYANPAVVTESHTQSVESREDGSTSIKRQMTRKVGSSEVIMEDEPVANHTQAPTKTRRSKSADHRRYRAGRGYIDVTRCQTEEEARAKLDDYWSPPPLGPVKETRTKVQKVQAPPTPVSLSPEPEAREQAERRHSDSSNPSTLNSFGFLHTIPPQPPQILQMLNLPTPRRPFSRALRTPESLAGEPDDNITRNKQLEQSLNALFLEDDDDFLVPSVFKQEKRAAEAAARKAREREAALQAEKEKREAAIKAAKERRLRRQHPLKKLVQPLDSKWEEVISRLQYINNHQQVLAKSQEGTELRHKDFNTLLQHRAWLNDEIINTYIEWVVDAANKAAVIDAEAAGEPSSTVPKFIAHNSFFYQNLIKKGPQSTERLMKRKKAPGASLMEVDTVFVPICSGAHWTIGVVRPVAKTIEYFDSMGGSPSKFISLMRGWLKFQLGDKYVETEWKEPRTACAHQSNGYDCGVFVCTNAFCVAMGIDTSCYMEHDMSQQRRNIAAVLVNRGFVGDFAWGEGGLLE